MPIRFRCAGCNQLLSIATKMAGRSVNCPGCGVDLTVPEPDAEPTPKKPAEEPAAEQKSQVEETLADEPAAQSATGPDMNQLFDDDDDLFEEEQHSEEQSFEEDEQAEQEELDEFDSAEYQEFVPEETAAAEESTGPSLRSRDEDEDDDDDEDDFQLRKAETDFEEMDLTPMVDVTFLLLIFFMITASFSVQKSISVPAPDPDKQGAAQSLQTLDDFKEDSVIVDIDANNVIYIDDEPVSDPSLIEDRLSDKMRSEAKTELILTADTKTLHNTVVLVIDAANEVGMQKIRLASNAESD